MAYSNMNLLLHNLLPDAGKSENVTFVSMFEAVALHDDEGPSSRETEPQASDQEDGRVVVVGILCSV